MTRSTTQTRLEQALNRLLAGQPVASDSDLTISSLCREAGVGRDSFYRSPQQFKDSVAAAFAAQYGGAGGRAVDVSPGPGDGW